MARKRNRKNVSAATNKNRKVRRSAARFLLYILPFLMLFIALASAWGYEIGKISYGAAEGLSVITTSMLFSTAVIAYLTMRGLNLSGIKKSLGLDNTNPKLRMISWGLGLFIIVFILEIALAGFEAVTGVSLPTNVASVLGGLPIYALVFTVVIAPINEEILFRGFLVPRIGIILSAVIFAIPHLLTYSSVAELAGAFVFGLIAGYAFKKTKSLWPSIIAHVMVNLIAVLPLLPLIKL